MNQVQCKKCLNVYSYHEMPKTPTGIRYQCKKCLHKNSLRRFHLNKYKNKIPASETITAILSIINRPEIIKSSSIDGVLCSTNGEIVITPKQSCVKPVNLEKITRGQLGKRGYYVIQTEDKKLHYVHRLIAEAFIGESRLAVNHINGIKTDNSLKNLEYVDSKTNSIHAKIFIKNKKKAYKHNINCKNLWYSRITVDGKDVYLGSFKTKKDAAKAYDEAEARYLSEYLDRYKKEY